jgi:hypothetical protein
MDAPIRSTTACGNGYLGAGRDGDVNRILDGYKGDPIKDRDRRMVSANLVASGRGAAAFWRGDYETAVDRLHGARFIANSFGGSHAQRDVIDWTLTEAAVRGGLNDLAKRWPADASRSPQPDQSQFPVTCPGKGRHANLERTCRPAAPNVQQRDRLATLQIRGAVKSIGSAPSPNPINLRV